MFQAGVGIGEGIDAYAAGVMAVTKAVTELRRDNQDHSPGLAFLFSSSKYELSSVVRGVQSVLGDEVLLAGASTAGEITKNGPTIRESVVVMLIASDTVSFTGAVSESLGEFSEAAGSNLASAIQEKNGNLIKLALVFSDGLRGNGTALLRGMLQVLGKEFPVVGGSAADNGEFKETHQILGDNIYTDAVVGVGASGNLAFSVGVRHGWNSVGAPRTVTAATGPQIITIDGQPAFDVYKDYLGEEAEELRKYTLGQVALSYPLGMRDPSCGERLLRAPFSVHDDGSIVCTAEIPSGTEIQLMMGAKEDAVAAARIAATNAMEAMESKPQAALVFSSYVRNTLFVDDLAASQEMEAIRGVIGDDVPVAGFYTYAEQAPVGVTTHNKRTCESKFHNETVVVLLLGEV